METRINRDATFHERQRAALQDILDLGWGNVDGAILEGAVVARAAVMLLIGMKDHHLAGTRMTRRAAISEALNAA